MGSSFALCGLFSRWAEWGLLSGCHAQASHYGGFSFSGFSLRWLLFTVAFLAAEAKAVDAP